MEEKSRRALRQSGDQSREPYRAEELEAPDADKESLQEGRIDNRVETDEEEDKIYPSLEVEIVDTEDAPAMLTEYENTTKALVNGDLSIEQALGSCSPAVRRKVSAFIRRYAFADVREVMKQLRQANVVDALLSEDVVTRVHAVRLAQQEEALEREAEAKDVTRSNLSDEARRIADKLKADKIARRERKE